MEKKAKKHLKDMAQNQNSSHVHVVNIKDGSFDSPWEVLGSIHELFQSFIQEREPNTIGRVSCGCAGMPFETWIGTKKSMRKKLRQDLQQKMKEMEKKKQKNQAEHISNDSETSSDEDHDDLLEETHFEEKEEHDDMLSTNEHVSRKKKEAQKKL